MAFQFLFAAVLYLLTTYLLILSAWSLIHRWVPPHSSRGFQLLTTFFMVLALNGSIVQALGWTGILTSVAYTSTVLTVSLILAGPKFKHLHESMVDLLCQNARDLIRHTPYSLWFLFLAMIPMLIDKSLLIQEFDSLERELPRMVPWVRDGVVDFTKLHHFPPMWEYQFVPGMLFGRTAMMKIVPWAVLITGLFLTVTELLRHLRVAIPLAYLTAWLCVLTPLVWVGNTGVNSVKNDIAIGAGLSAILLTLVRAYSGRSSVLLLTQLSGFLLHGTKLNGIPFFGLVFPLVFALELRRIRNDRATLIRTTGLWLGVSLAVQAYVTAVYLGNIYYYQNPFFPLATTIAGVNLTTAGRDISGLSLLDWWSNGEMWREYLRGCTDRVGLEFAPVVFIPLLACLHGMLSRRVRLRIGGAPISPVSNLILGCLFIAFWFLFLQAPFTRGHFKEDMQFAIEGQSIRFAFGQIILAYVLTIAYLNRIIRTRTLLKILAILAPLLLFYKWKQAFQNEEEPARNLFGVLLGMLLIYTFQYLPRWAARIRQQLALPSPLPSWIKHGFGFVTAVFILVLLTVRTEQKRQHSWIPSVDPAWKFVWTHYPDNTVIATNPKVYHRYPFFGPNLTNRLEPMEIENHSVRVPEEASVIFIQTSDLYETFDFNQLTAALQQQEWIPVLYNPEVRSAVFQKPKYKQRKAGT